MSPLFHWTCQSTQVIEYCRGDQVARRQRCCGVRPPIPAYRPRVPNRYSCQRQLEPGHKGCVAARDGILCKIPSFSSGLSARSPRRRRAMPPPRVAPKPAAKADAVTFRAETAEDCAKEFRALPASLSATRGHRWVGAEGGLPPSRLQDRHDAFVSPRSHLCCLWGRRLCLLAHQSSSATFSSLAKSRSKVLTSYV